MLQISQLPHIYCTESKIINWTTKEWENVKNYIYMWLTIQYLQLDLSVNSAVLDKTGPRVALEQVTKNRFW